MRWYSIADLNPEPWQPSRAAAAEHGKKILHYKPIALDNYQQAVKQEFQRRYPDVEMMTGKLELVFVFWRQLEGYELNNRKASRNVADATNMQKALEDALQGVLFANDREVKHVESTVAEEGPDVRPFIIVGVGPFIGVDARWPASIEHERVQTPALFEPTPDYNRAAAADRIRDVF